MNTTEEHEPRPDDQQPLMLPARTEARVRRYGTYAWMWLGIVGLAIVAYLVIASLVEFVIPLVVATVLGVVFVPLVDVVTRWMPRGVAAGVVLAGIVVAVVAAVVLVVVGIIQQGPQIAREFRSAFEQLSGSVDRLDIELAPAAELTDRVGQVVSDAAPALLEAVPSAVDVATGLIAGIFVALFILYYVLADWDDIAHWVGTHLDVPHDLGAGIVQDAVRSFREYFYVLTASSIPVAVIIGLTAAVIGVPLAFTIALVTMVTSYIPYIGALISSLFAVLIAFGSGGIVPAVIMVVAIIVAQGLVQPIIQTRMQRDTMDIHPVVAFGATVVGSVLAGVLGATLSAPVAAMLMRVRQRVDAYERGEDLGLPGGDAAADAPPEAPPTEP